MFPASLQFFAARPGIDLALILRVDRFQRNPVRFTKMRQKLFRSFTLLLFRQFTCLHSAIFCSLPRKQIVSRLDLVHQFRLVIVLPDRIQQLILRIFAEYTRKSFMDQ